MNVEEWTDVPTCYRTVTLGESIVTSNFPKYNLFV